MERKFYVLVKGNKCYSAMVQDNVLYGLESYENGKTNWNPLDSDSNVIETVKSELQEIELGQLVRSFKMGWVKPLKTSLESILG